MEQKPEKEGDTGALVDSLEGTLERFTFQNKENGFAVVRFLPDGAREPLRAVGALAQLAEGQRLKLCGRIVEHPRYGRQLQVQSAQAILPSTVEGIRAYLASSLIRGIGPATAAKITDCFGADTLRVIEEEPERLSEVPGLGKKRIRELVQAVLAQKDVQEVMIFLRAHGLGEGLATRIVKHYGSGASALIQANPYRLAEEVIGIGFRTADRLALELGMAPEAPERIQAGILYCLTQAAREGHCYLPEARLLEAATNLLDCTAEAVRKELPELGAQCRIFLQGPPGPKVLVEEDSSRIYPATLEEAEAGVAEALDYMLGEERQSRPGLRLEAGPALEWYERRSGISLPQSQRDAVRTALTHPVSVITGGPGVGKTTIIRALVEILAAKELRVRLAAPTGRAAKRLQESTGHEASTIHRLLEFQPGTNRFQRDALNPLAGDLLVVDEISMLDIQLAYNLFRAVPASMKLVLVGDADQLPAVGPGQVLRDIIDSGRLPVTLLTKIYRQKAKSLIVRNAHALLRGELPESGSEEQDFFVVEARSSSHIRELVSELVVQRIPKRFGLDAMRDIQVLCPMYRGQAGADIINKDLQQKLNPGQAELERAGKSFRRGDKVMQIRNDYDLDLYNGDVGQVAHIDRDKSTLSARFGSRMVEYPFADLDALVPAYAISVHRSQGSEYPAVVLPLSTDHFMLLKRNLLYTAITRGRLLVVLVCTPKALGMAVRNNEEAGRYSGLAERLRDQLRHHSP